jgi:hypothetical protein
MSKLLSLATKYIRAKSVVAQVADFDLEMEISAIH